MSEQEPSEEQETQKYSGAIELSHYWICRIAAVFLIVLGVVLCLLALKVGLHSRICLRLGIFCILVAGICLYFGWPSESEKNGYRF